MGKDAVLTVQLFEAKPNAMFTEAQRQLVCFLRYNLAVPCAECGTRSKYHWTMRVSFTAHTLPPSAFTVQTSGTVHLPLAPVCRAHPLAPAVYPAAPTTRRRASRATD